MKKILIDKALYSSLDKYETMLQRADVEVFTAETSDEVLSLHQQEKMNLIIARLDAPGLPPERIYGQIRNDPDLRAVSLILVCGDQPAEKLRAEHCGANAIVTKQDAKEVLDKANSFLKIPTRGSYRVLLNVTIDTDKSKSFFCRSENISVTGMLLETDRALAAGDRLNCSFFLPGAKQIDVSGEVVRIITSEGKAGHKQYGLKFTKISAMDVAAIRGFIRKKSERD